MKQYFIIFFILALFPMRIVGINSPKIYQININREIDPTSRLYLSKGLAEARKSQAVAVILHLNTYGGSVVDADSMRSSILYNQIPVYVFIDNNAASAGALISIACKGIYMRKGANIGAATVVNQTGEVLPDKYQSYMRSTIRATAEAHGKDTLITGNDTTYRWKRDPRIAEAMVDERIVIPAISDSGKILTLTAQEALKLGYCDGIAENIDEVISNYLGFKEYKLDKYEPGWQDSLKGFLLNPAFQAFLIMIIIAGIYFELQSPGIGFPAAAALIAAILYFAPLYIDGLAQNWEVLIFVAGILLVLAELFIIPGFGIAGISGIILTILGLSLALLNNDLFSFENVKSPDYTRSLQIVFIGIVLAFSAILYLSSKIGKKGMFRHIALEKDLETSSNVDLNDRKLIGKTGEAMTVLRPSGKIIIEGEVYDAVSDEGFIEKGIKVKIIRFENAQLYVERI